MPADLGGNGFESLAEEVDFDHDAAERVGLSITASMFFDDGTQFGTPVKSGFGNSCVRGDGREGDSLASFDQLGAGQFHSCDQISAHADWASEISRSRRSMRRRCRAASSPQPRASASATSASVSTRWVSSVGRKVASERKFGQCSQMFV